MRPASASAQVAGAQTANAQTLPQCYTQVVPAGSPLPASPAAQGPALVVGGSSCAEYPEYAPLAYDQQHLPAIPIKTVRIMFHVFQKDDGSDNWQSPSQDNGADEAILRGLVYGIDHYPTSSSPPNRAARGLNGIYSGLDNRITNYTSTVPTPAPNPLGDSRIRFQLEGIRYYRNTYYYDMTTGTPVHCGDGEPCVNDAYDTFVTHSTATSVPGLSQPALTAEQKTHIIHIFLGENPGLPSAQPDRFGNLTSRYFAGGRAITIPDVRVNLRGFYWAFKHHPYWSAGGIANTDPLQALKYLEYVLAHELGHALGLAHVFGIADGCTLSYNDPPISNTANESNNIMDGGAQAGFSFSQCQIGKMHYFLGHAGIPITLPGTAGTGYVDNTLVEDYCQTDPSQDVVVASGQNLAWNSAHNLRGNLFIEAGATLTVRCRVGFVGPNAKVVVRGGGELILDNGTLGNFATSDVHECGQDIRLQLGGDGSDGDNSGLITVRNGGGFTSEHLRAELTAGATLHIEPAVVHLDKCQLETLPQSFLCVEPGANFTYAGPAQLVIDPQTVLGLNPAIHLQANCTPDLCTLLGQAVAFTASTLDAQGNGTPICSGTGVTMSAQAGQAGTYTVEWYRNGRLVSNNPTYQDTPTGSSTVTYQAIVTLANGCPPVTWSFSQPIQPVPTISLLTNAATVCANGTGGNYVNGRFNLNSITGSIRDPNASANQNTTAYWVDPMFSGIVTSGYNQAAGAFVRYLNIPLMRTRGLTSYTVQLCNQSASGAIPCPICLPVTVTLDAGPAFTVTQPAAASCKGQAVTLMANGPGGTTYTWQPGNLQGSSVSVAPTTTTTYTVTGSNGTCPAVAQQVQVNVLRLATCTDCLNGGYVAVNSAGTTFATYSFAPGKTYLFSQNTVFTTSTFTIPEGAALVFGKDITLTLRNGAQLDLRGGILTGNCEAMWNGIVAEQTSAGVVSQQPATVLYSEISHSRNGLLLLTGPSGQPTLQLAYVSFLHNGQGVQVTNSGISTSAFTGMIENCLFDSNYRLMRGEWAYHSATDLHVSRRHIALAGNCANLTVRNNVLDHALFAFWVPNYAPFRAENNTIRNFYVAGLYALESLTSDTQLLRNTFEYPPAANEISTSHSPQLQDVFANDLAYEGPGSFLREGACIGIFGPSLTSASGPTFTLEDNRFIQPLALTTYADQVPYPQYGVITTGGVLRHGIFRNLQIGYLSRSTQHGGMVQDNLFSGCIYGVYFLNGLSPQATSGAGEAVVSCNTFERLANIPGTNMGIVRDFCQQQTTNGSCDQIDISTVPGAGTTQNPVYQLQKNKFIGTATSGGFIHIYNADGNVPIVYSTFSSIWSNIIVNDPALVQAQNSGVQLVASTATVLGNDCLADGFPNYGLRGIASPLSSSVSTTINKEEFLAQNVPNPCTGITSISYRTIASGTDVQLVFRDYYSGAVVLRQSVPAGEHTVKVNVSKLLPGGYHYALEADGRAVAHHNLMVQ